ncbi:hypothetical protein EXIGLDRAFT_78086 [Exidia glandulosa HHB12029]|uniref:FAD/NAD(P)-binding domain-containing protein n=1 Tax=Exidia glandulosa HHB12029 TaxID=1314781 RepID=A0A165NYW0_EXIGL|nr:hypothetical protein EXIGLDRAFT_78086 [Exidia glandulosa HHB12029]
MLVAVSLALLIAALVLLAHRALKTHLLRTYTGILDLPALGTTRKGKDGKKNGTAVVCGGSIAGLLAARVLSSHFTRVLIIEPDACTFTSPYGFNSGDEKRDPDPYPDEKTPTTYGTRSVTDARTGTTYNVLKHDRSRVWQYPAMHVFQVLLTRVLRRLFPGFDAHAQAAGIRLAPGDFILHLGGSRLHLPSQSPILQDPNNYIMFSSRRVFETLLRRLVTGVEFVQGTATAFNLGEGGMVESVEYRDTVGLTQRVGCALVADCTGNTQLGLKLLTRSLNLSHSPITILREEYDPRMCYASVEVCVGDEFEAALASLDLRDPTTGDPLNTKAQGWFYTLIPDPAVDYRTLLLGRRDGGGGACFFLRGCWGGADLVLFLCLLSCVWCSAFGLRFSFRAAFTWLGPTHRAVLRFARRTRCAFYVLPVALPDRCSPSPSLVARFYWSLSPSRPARPDLAFFSSSLSRLTARSRLPVLIPRPVVFGFGGWDSAVPLTFADGVSYARFTNAPDWVFDILNLLQEEVDRQKERGEVGEVVFVAKCTSCSRVRYESSDAQVPGNFVALGDACMRLNPRLGEGCTKAALCALTLDGVLRRTTLTPKVDIGKTYFKLLGKRCQGLWDASRWMDYGRATSVPVKGETLEEGATFRRFSRVLYRVVAKDEGAATEVWKNMMFLSPPGDVMRPSILVRVFWEAVFGADE